MWFALHTIRNIIFCCMKMGPGGPKSRFFCLGSTLDEAMAEQFYIGEGVAERVGDAMHGNRGLADAAIAGAMSVGSLVYGAMTRSVSAPDLTAAVPVTNALQTCASTDNISVPVTKALQTFASTDNISAASPFLSGAASAMAGPLIGAAVSIGTTYVAKKISERKVFEWSNHF